MNSWRQLSGLFAEAGFTILGSVLGGPAGGIAVTVGREIAQALGADGPDGVARAIKDDPRAMEELERYQALNAEKLALLAQEQDHMRAILEREDDGPWFKWGWRPAIMWLIGFLWLYSLVLVHFLNGVTDLALPVAPLEHLLAFTGLFLSLYMGGHTVKSVFDKRRG